MEKISTTQNRNSNWMIYLQITKTFELLVLGPNHYKASLGDSFHLPVESVCKMLPPEMRIQMRVCCQAIIRSINIVQSENITYSAKNQQSKTMKSSQTRHLLKIQLLKMSSFLIENTNSLSILMWFGGLLSPAQNFSRWLLSFRGVMFLAKNGPRRRPEPFYITCF